MECHRLAWPIFLVACLVTILSLELFILVSTNVDESECGDLRQFPKTFVLYEEKFTFRSKMLVYDLPSASVDLDQQTPVGYFYRKILAFARTLRFVDTNGKIAASMTHVPFSFTTYLASACNSTDYYEISAASLFSDIDYHILHKGPSNPERGTKIAVIKFSGLLNTDMAVYTDESFTTSVARITKVSWFWRDQWEGRCEAGTALPCYVVGFLGHLSTVLSNEARNRRIRSSANMLAQSSSSIISHTTSTSRYDASNPGSLMVPHWEEMPSNKAGQAAQQEVTRLTPGMALPN